MPPEVLIDLSELDFAHPIADRAAIYQVLPHRHEFELLDGIVLIDRPRELMAGFMDVRSDAFWTRGHFPAAAILPGVLQCEAAAQLGAYYIGTIYPELYSFIALGGLENVRFRSMVRPGDRFVLVGQATKIHRRQMTFAMQGFVDGTMVFHGDVYGMPTKLPEE